MPDRDRPAAYSRIDVIRRALRGRPPIVLTLPMMSRISADVVDRFAYPAGGAVDQALDALVRAGLLEKEPGYFGGVRPADIPPMRSPMGQRWAWAEAHLDDHLLEIAKAARSHALEPGELHRVLDALHVPDHPNEFAVHRTPRRRKTTRAR